MTCLIVNKVKVTETCSILLCYPRGQYWGPSVAKLLTYKDKDFLIYKASINTLIYLQLYTHINIWQDKHIYVRLYTYTYTSKHTLLYVSLYSYTYTWQDTNIYFSFKSTHSFVSASHTHLRTQTHIYIVCHVLICFALHTHT